MSGEPDLSVIIPCFNESEIVEATATRLLQVLPPYAQGVEIIFCNDGSTDDTAAKIAALANRHDSIVAVGYAKNRGAGYAFRQGLEAARGAVVIHMDADLAMDPADVCAACLKGLETSDIVIASRYKGVQADYPLRRRLPSLVYRLIYRLLLALPIQDAMSGFFAMRRTVLSEIQPLEMDGFEVYLELFVKARKCGIRIDEVPVKFTHQTESGEVSVLASAPKQLLNTLRVWWRFRLGIGSASRDATAAHC